MDTLIGILRRKPQMNRVIRLIQHLLCQRRTSVEDFFDQPVIDQIHRLTGHLGFEFIPPRRVFCGGLFGHLLQPRTNAFDRILGGAKLQCRLCKAIDQPLIGAPDCAQPTISPRSRPSRSPVAYSFRDFCPACSHASGAVSGSLATMALNAAGKRSAIASTVRFSRIVGDTLTYLEL